MSINAEKYKFRNAIYTGITLCMHPANERRRYIVFHWLGTYTKWSLYVFTVSACQELRDCQSLVQITFHSHEKEWHIIFINNKNLVGLYFHKFSTLIWIFKLENTFNWGLDMWCIYVPVNWVFIGSGMACCLSHTEALVKPVLAYLLQILVKFASPFNKK